MTDLLTLTRHHFPTADQPIGNPDSVVVHFSDVGTLVVTPTTDRTFYLLGFYPGDMWEAVDCDPVFAELSRPAEHVPSMLLYLNNPPEGVDHAAWIAQRLEDDGPDADAPTLPAHIAADLAHYRAEGGRFDAVAWWHRYAAHYTEPAGIPWTPTERRLQARADEQHATTDPEIEAADYAEALHRALTT